MLRTVHLHGRLGQKFGRRHEMRVNSAQEAVRALSIQIPGFRDYFRHRKYAVSIGDGLVIDEEQVPMRLGNQRDIHFTPAGLVSGVETILLGATLLLGAISVVMVLTQPRAPAAQNREEATKTASFMYDGAINSTEQGNVVQLVYGRMRVGSVVGSAGITTTDVTEAGVSANPDGSGKNYGGFVGSTPGIKDSPNGDEWVVEKGGKAGGGTARAAQEDPNSLQSQATAKVLDVIGEGEIVGLVDGLRSVYFDETPLQNADDSFNFAGVAVEQRVGLPDQDFIPGFTQAENSVSIDTKVAILTGPVTRSITDSDVTVARVTIRLPQLYQQNTENGDLKASTVALKISVQADGGGFTDVTTMTFTGKTNSGYQRSVDIRLPAGTNRDIRITRLTPDSNVASLSNETRWDILTEIVEAKLSYPDTALIGLTVDARQFGSNIPARSYDIKGLIIEVPSNYDPIARTYTGVWDGTFKRAWTDNPAWVLRDLVVQRRYGLGNRVPANAVDIWGLYAIAQYCDQLVPDGMGGMSPRFTINTCIRNEAQAYDLLASIASNFRGMIYWGSGSVMAAQDSPEDPSILVSPSNVVGGKISYGRVTPIERRRSAAVVWWNDPEDGFKLVPEIYEDPELIRRFGRRTGDEVTGYGITNRGQAHRAARWLIEDERPSSNTTATYQVGDDHSFVEPGRIAEVEDPMFTQNRRSGRVRTATASSITIDKAFTFLAGQTYSVRVMLPDGTVRQRPVTNGPGEAAVVTLGGTNFGTPPNPGAVWTLQSNLVQNRQFRVRAMSTDDAPYSVQAVSHDPSKYARVEQGIDLATPPYMDLPTGGLVPPDSITAYEFLLQDGTASIPCVQVSWRPSPDPRVTFYQAQYKEPNGDWQPFADSVDVSRIVRNATPGEWQFRARGIDSLGNKTAWIATTVTLDGHVDSLPNVLDLTKRLDTDALNTALLWTMPADVRPLRSEVMFHPTGNYNAAVSLGVIDGTEFIVSRPGTYWVRTRFIDAFSAAPPNVVVAAADLPGDTIADLEASFQSQIDDVNSQLAAAEAELEQAQDDIAAAQADIIAQGGDISTLESTVATQGGLITTNATAISNVAGNLASLTTTVSAQGTSITNNATAISTLNGQYASLSSTVSTQGSTISTQGTAITTLQGNYSTLNTTVTAQGATISTHTTAISDLTGQYATLNTTVGTLGASVSSNTSAISTLNTNYASLSSTVSAQGASITSNATAISTLNGQYSSLSSTVSTQGVTISSNTTAISGLTGNVATLFARIALTLDVNGYVTGYEINNSGTTGSFIINADTFAIIKPGGGERLEWSNGSLKAYYSNGVVAAEMGVWT